MITKRLFSLVCSIGVAAFIAASCQAPALEEIQEPGGQETEVVPEWTTIPYSLKVSTEKTRVATDQNATAYNFKAGDKIRITGTERTDIDGLLEPNEDYTLWTGTISYLTDNGELESGQTPLDVTLIHADNPDASTYASAIVGTGAIEGCVTEGQLLQYAVEHYSLFTATDTYRDQSAGPPTTAVTLSQKATFLDCTVTFKFDGTHEMGSGGNAKVDLITTRGEMRINSAFSQVEGTPDYTVHFMAVIPGGQTKDAFTLTVADRAITFSTTAALASNMLYTVKRNIEYGPQLGDPFWSDGTYGRMEHPDDNVKIVGIVVYVNHNYEEGTTAADIDDAITEKRTDSQGNQLYGHGLVMALTNAALDVPWSSSEGKTKCTTDFVTDPEHTLAVNTEVNTLSGYANTEAIRTILTEKGAYSGSAAYLAENYKYNDVSVSTTSTTGWFLPSIGQWMYTISEDGFGEADHASQWVNGNGVSWLKNGYSNDGDLGDLVLVKECANSQLNVLVKSLNDRLATFKEQFHVEYDPFGDPSSTNNVSDNYWTSSEKDANNAIRMNLGSVKRRGGKYYSTIKVKGEDKTKVTVYTENGIDYKMKVRPFLAF